MWGLLQSLVSIGGLRVDSLDARTCYSDPMVQVIPNRFCSARLYCFKLSRNYSDTSDLAECERTHACVEGDANPLDDVHKDFLPLFPGGVVCHHRLGDSSPWDAFAWVHKNGGSPQIGQLLDVELDRLVEDVGFQGLGGSGLGITHVLQDQAG
jgi:hypothetical protein